jgi:squalene-hopene/tetraprenyl-beta-curcumene cyclase
MRIGRIARPLLAAGLLLPAALALRPKPIASPAESAQPAIDRAVAYVLAKGDAWIAERKCVSCHMIPGMVWSLAEARGGKPNAALPDSRYRALVDWTLKDSLSEYPGNEGLAQLMVADLAAGDKAADARMNEFAAMLIARQSRDGSWSPGGQTPEQKRAVPEGKEAVTMWAILALDRVLGSRADDAIRRGRESLKFAGAKRSAEWASLRLQVALTFGETTAAAEQLARILDSQNADGGWGWILGQESDAIATGQTLYTLSLVPSAKIRPAIDRARRFLIRTQCADGAWQVKGTLAQHQTVVMPTSMFWGTTWAIIGLARTEPR